MNFSVNPHIYKTTYKLRLTRIYTEVMWEKKKKKKVFENFLSALNLLGIFCKMGKFSNFITKV